ncbi:MAG: hypothetical protein FWF51_01550 [Chitinivibrionia bacterium]|nr:hypothetical protein [Chitinivibrionia bacterium]
MVIERNAKEFIIRMPVVSQIERVQELVDYFRYIELTSGYNVPQDEVDAFAKEINKNWLNVYENRS